MRPQQTHKIGAVYSLDDERAHALQGCDLVIAVETCGHRSWYRAPVVDLSRASEAGTAHMDGLVVGWGPKTLAVARAIKACTERVFIAVAAEWAPSTVMNGLLKHRGDCAALSLEPGDVYAWRYNQFAGADDELWCVFDATCPVDEQPVSLEHLADLMEPAGGEE